MNNYLEIAGRRIGADYEPVVIAEIGINHGGDLDLAISMVDEAKKAGATEEEIKIAVMIAGVVSLNSTVLYGNQYSQEKLKKMLE